MTQERPVTVGFGVIKEKTEPLSGYWGHTATLRLSTFHTSLCFQVMNRHSQNIGKT